MVLATVNERTSKAEAIAHLMEGFDTAFKQRLAISSLIVEGK